jgi:hypothetical protein
MEEIDPQLLRIEEKEAEVKVIADTLVAMKTVLDGENDFDSRSKCDQLASAIDPDKIQKALLGHRTRYVAWTHVVPPMDSMKQPVSASRELSAFGNAVNVCETVAARGSPDAITTANSEVRKLYTPSRIKKGMPEDLAEMLDAMERFIFDEIDLATLEQRMRKGVKVLNQLDSAISIDKGKIRAAVDVAQRIINHKDDDTFFSSDPKLKQEFTDVVYDAWGNISLLQA